MYCVINNNNNNRVLHPVKDMGSEMFELCDTPHYFVFRRVGLNSALKKKTKKKKYRRDTLNSL